MIIFPVLCKRFTDCAVKVRIFSLYCISLKFLFRKRSKQLKLNKLQSILGNIYFNNSALFSV